MKLIIDILKKTPFWSTFFVITLIPSIWLLRGIGTWDTMVFMFVSFPINVIALTIIIVTYTIKRKEDI